METSSRFGQFWSRITDKLNDQVWFQQLKSKWEELDPASRGHLVIGSIIGATLLIMLTLGSFFLKVHGMKTELAEKSEILRLIQSANTEMRKLKDSTPGGASPARGGDGVPWNSFFETTASSAGVDKASITISPENKLDNSRQFTESLFDISIKHVNIKQIVRFSFFLENSGRPVKVRNLMLDTNNDPSGYIDATISVSGFTLKQGS